MRGLVLCAVLALAVVLLVPEGESFCCGNIFGGVCGDCTLGTPCCATRPCNIFCCACKGQCRSGSCRGRRSAEGDDGHPHPEHHGNHTTTGQDVVDVADLNGNGLLEFDEAVIYLTKTKGYDGETARSKLIEIDVDRDGIISVKEIDE